MHIFKRKTKTVWYQALLHGQLAQHINEHISWKENFFDFILAGDNFTLMDS